MSEASSNGSALSAAASTGSKDFLVPDLGEGLEELTIVAWLVSPGDAIALNQPLCLVETAKAEVEIPSPFGGVLAIVGGEEGETLRVGTLLARFSTEIAVDPAAIPPPSQGQPTLVGYGHDASIDRSRRRDRSASPDGTTQAQQFAGPASTPAPTPGAQRPLAKPPVRQLARDLGVVLADIGTGSGAGGVITRDDVLERAQTMQVEPNGGGPKPASGGAAPAPTIIPVVGVRARIAQRMTMSHHQIPDASCSVVVDCWRLITLRSTLNDALSKRGEPAELTPFSLICSFAVRALERTPILNSTFVEDVPEIRIFPSVNLGIGTATDRGLVVAVIKQAERMSTAELATTMGRLSASARSGSIAPHDLSGSTFTVSNFGALGLDEGVPVINHPEAAILGVGLVKLRPVVVDGEVVARPTGRFTLAFDHRVCDGTEAAAFLRDLRQLVENPELMLLDR